MNHAEDWSSRARPALAGGPRPASLDMVHVRNGMGEAPTMKPCFIVDVSVAWVAWPLWRRGFMVFFPARDYPVDASDAELAEWALKTGCVLVTSDEGCARLAERMGARAVHVPHWWGRRYNSWEIVTRIVKYGVREVIGNGQ